MKNRLSDLIEELHDGFCSVRLDGEIAYANHSALKLLKIIDPDGINFFENSVRNKGLVNLIKSKMKTQTELKDIESYLYDCEGNKFPVILTVTPIRDLDSATIGMAILFKDMSQLKTMHAQLLQAQKMESIGMLASGIAHEFNNILSGIIPNAELIKMTVDQNDANFSRADSIHKSAQRAANIVKQLLSFARNDHLEDNVALDLTQTVSETLEIMGKLFGKDIIVENNMPLNLPPIKADPTRIQQIVMNLAINARDAIEGSGKIVFWGETSLIESGDQNGLLPGQYIRMNVSDSGKGIEPKNLSKIFDPFFTTKEPGKGTGLGLSTVYGIVKNLNGDIKVSSQVGKGTKFEIYFPASEISLNEVIDEEVFLATHSNKTILIVDDEKVIRDMAKDLLTYMGYNTIIAKNGFEAIDVFMQNKNKIDLILLDLIMPKLNGVATFNKIRKIDDKIPVIITSGVGEANKKSDMIRMGAADYLQKPYSLKLFSDAFSQIFVEN